MIDRASVEVMAKEMHSILAGGEDATDKHERIVEVLKAHGTAGDWPSVRDLLVSKGSRTLEEVEATLKYIFCLPLSYDERRHVVGANGLFFGQDSERKIGGTAKRTRKRAK
jgi:hypothetical protein